MGNWRSDPRNVSRGRGILSEGEREYYLGESDIEHKSQKERSIRSRAREHLHNAILDFTVLMGMEQRDLDKVLNRKESKLGTPQFDDWMEMSMKSGISILYNYYDDVDSFADVIESGIEHRESRKGSTIQASVDIELEGRSELGLLYDTLNTYGPDRLTGKELGALYDAGKISAEKFAEFASQKEIDDISS